VYDKLENCLEKATNILVMIAGDKDLKSVEALIRSVDQDSWKDKIVMNCASHEPHAAKRLEEEVLKPMNVHHIAVALIAVPETFGTPQAVILTSPSTRSVKEYEKVSSLLELMGRLEMFEGDIGYGALVDMGLIWGCFLGVHGYELALIACEKYGASDEVHTRLLSLSKELLPQYIELFFGSAFHAIRNKDWKGPGVTTSASDSKTYSMHQDFLQKIGIVDDTIMGSLVKYTAMAAAADPESNDHFKVTQYLVQK
jgi:hypothetical protein